MTAAQVAALTAAGIVAWLIGHAAYRLGAPAAGIGRSQLGERTVVQLAFGAMLLTWWAVFLAEIRWFGLVALLVPPAVGALGVLVARSGADRPAAQPGDARRVGLLLCVLVAGAISWHEFVPAFDVRLEARDPGVYYLAGVNLAKRGSIDYTDPTILELTEEQQGYFFPPVGRIGAMESNRFIGYYVEDVETGRVVPQALPALPVWVATGYLGAGQLGSELATPLLAFLAMLGLFLLTYRMVDNAWVSLAVAALMGASFVEAWFARYMAAEIPAQFFVLFGLYGLVMHRRHGGAFFGVLGGLGLGLMWFAKAELLLMGAPLALLLLADALHGRAWKKRSFWIVLALAGVHTFWHALEFVWPYYFDLLRQYGVTPRRFFVALAIGAVGYVVLFVLAAVVGARAPEARARVLRGWPGWALRVLLAIGLPVTAAIGYWLRPTWYPGGTDGWWEAYNVVEIGWAVSPLVLAFAVLGTVILLLERDALPGVRAAASVLVFAAVLLLWHKQINPFLLWAYRRWVPVVIPAFYVGAAYLTARVGALAAGALQRVAPRAKSFEPAVAGIVAVGLLVPSARYQLAHREPYASHVEMPGIAAILTELERVIEPGSLILFEPRTRRGLVRFEAALALGMDRRVLRIIEPDVQLDQLMPLLWSEAARGRPPVYLLTTGYLNGLLRPLAVPVHTFIYETERLVEEATMDRFEAGRTPAPPGDLVQLRIEAHLYRLETTGTLQPLEYELDVGLWDHLYLDGQYMHTAEVDSEGRTYRWTTARGGFYLPGLPARARELVVDADPGNEPELVRPVITATLDGVPLGEVQTIANWQQYRFAIPVEWAPDPTAPPHLVLEIEPTFRPVDAIPGRTDTRTLGIKVNRVSWYGTADDAER